MGETGAGGTGERRFQWFPRGSKAEETRKKNNYNFKLFQENKKGGALHSASLKVVQPFWQSYSTVTDLARLRGWSTLHPRITATW